MAPILSSSFLLLVFFEQKTETKVPRPGVNKMVELILPFLVIPSFRESKPRTSLVSQSDKSSFKKMRNESDKTIPTSFIVNNSLVCWKSCKAKTRTVFFNDVIE
eukprot:Lithocolla_globosa_v1_NODE_2303_length_2059_cov_5.739521.p2 type:complete len:104 gc:universal NODE_2303_length_2059_cov_5.739521:1358-1669(+)